MRSKVVLLLLAFLPLISSEYYCYVKGLGKSCRRCKNLSESCERPLPSQGCQCDHIEILRGKFLPTNVKTNILKYCIFQMENMLVVLTAEVAKMTYLGATSTSTPSAGTKPGLVSMTANYG